MGVLKTLAKTSVLESLFNKAAGLRPVAQHSTAQLFSCEF